MLLIWYTASLSVSALASAPLSADAAILKGTKDDHHQNGFEMFLFANLLSSQPAEGSIQQVQAHQSNGKK